MEDARLDRDGAPLRVSARRRGRARFEVTLRGYVATCEPAPRFDARLDRQTLHLVERPLPRGTEHAMCSCTFDLRLSVTPAPGPVTKITVLDRVEAAYGSRPLVFDVSAP